MIQRFSDVNIHIHIQWFRNTVMQKIYTSTPRCDAKYRDAKWQDTIMQKVRLKCRDVWMQWC